jgi:hypothetical protein
MFSAAASILEGNGVCVCVRHCAACGALERRARRVDSRAGRHAGHAAERAGRHSADAAAGSLHVSGPRCRGDASAALSAADAQLQPQHAGAALDESHRHLRLRSQVRCPRAQRRRRCPLADTERTRCRPDDHTTLKALVELGVEKHLAKVLLAGGGDADSRLTRAQLAEVSDVASKEAVVEAALRDMTTEWDTVRSATHLRPRARW